MELSVVEEDGLAVVEGQPDQPWLRSAADAIRIAEACMDGSADAMLLYAPNLPPAFFDLSSGTAGEILQKLVNYRIRLAVVCPPDSVQFSRRFGDVLVEAGLGQSFRIVDTRDAARAWLREKSR